MHEREREKRKGGNKEERKLTDENNGFFSLPETRTETNPRANSIGFETIEINLVLIH